MPLSVCWILLAASLSLGEEPHKKPNPLTEDPYLLWRLDVAREKAREIPQTIWGRSEGSEVELERISRSGALARGRGK